MRYDAMIVHSHHHHHHSSPRCRRYHPNPPGTTARAPRRPSQPEGRSIRANVGVELKGVRGGVERHRGRGLKARGGRRDAPGRVLKERRSQRKRGRMGTSVNTNAPEARTPRAIDETRWPRRTLSARPPRRRTPPRRARCAARPSPRSATRACTDPRAARRAVSLRIRTRRTRARSRRRCQPEGMDPRVMSVSRA